MNSYNSSSGIIAVLHAKKICIFILCYINVSLIITNIIVLYFVKIFYPLSKCKNKL